VLEAQVRRMLADPRADALVDNFAAQWLQFRSVPSQEPSPDLFPGVDAPLKQAMRDQTALFFREFVRSDRSALDMLDADFSWACRPRASGRTGRRRSRGWGKGDRLRF
jgi:Protein of unknown function (DUF1592)